MDGIWKGYKVFNYIKLVGIWISGISVLVMMLFIVYDVTARTLFSGSIRGGFEIIQNYLMPLVVFPGLAFAYSSGVLPKMDLILDKVSEKVQKVIIFSMLLVELFVLVLIVQFSWEYAMSSLERKTSFPAAGTLYPLYPLFFLIPAAFAMIVTENVFILIRNILVKEPSLLMINKEEKPEELL
ncbi:TRAP transporter small permease subunit [Metabacillus herbersteinensis]|uniref:TRAP transporter small permease subunit n=1 Tax=Metabacillus herbersteinensis TaxID=283816 RepID=A0ABV6GFP9_9BACI